MSDAEIDEQIQVLKEQNRLGNDSKVFEDVLKDYWGWSVSDFRRSIANELLAQKVLGKPRHERTRALKKAYAELQSGKDFAVVAKETSDDVATKDKEQGSLAY